MRYVPILSATVAGAVLPIVLLSFSSNALPTNFPRPSEAAEEERVAPGLVNWHPSYEAACDAALDSGRPVLLFQLLGNLDDAFC